MGFAFYTEIQDGCKKKRENDFGKRSQMTPGYPGGQKFCRNCCILHCFQDKGVIAFYAENSRWTQKMGDQDFWGKSPNDSACAFGVETFVEIAPSCTVSEINAFCILRRNLR